MNTTLNFLHYFVLYFVNVWVILAMFTYSRAATLHFAGALWPQAEVFLLQPVHLMLLPQVLFSAKNMLVCPLAGIPMRRLCFSIFCLTETKTLLAVPPPSSSAIPRTLLTPIAHGITPDAQLLYSNPLVRA